MPVIPQPTAEDFARDLVAEYCDIESCGYTKCDGPESWLASVALAASARAIWAEAEIARLTKLLAEPELLRFEATKAGTTLEMEHWAVRALFALFVKTLADAPNYVTMDIADPDTSQALTITIQRQYGKSPTQTIAELRAENARLRSFIRPVVAAYDDLLYHCEGEGHADPNCPQDDTCQCPGAQRLNVAFFALDKLRKEVPSE